MKKTLYVKFILAYLIFGLLIFFTIATLGSQLVENRMVEDTSLDLYEEAYSIAGSHAAKYYRQESSLQDLYNNLSVVSSYHDTQIWIISRSGTILLNTHTSFSENSQKEIPNFNAANFGPSYYEVGHFYNQFNTEYLSVMVPITYNMTTRGYVAIHASMHSIYEARESVLGSVYLVFLVVYLLSYIILLVFTFSVYSPLRKITSGVTEYAAGNLKHRIPVKSNDEMGYLADTLNYMSNEIEQANTYQKSFIANISHDFRSPLTSIKGYAEAMSDGTIPPDMYEKYLGIISFEADRLNTLTRGMLTLNSMDKKRGIEKTRFDINSVIKNTAAAFEGTCRKKKISIELLLESRTQFVNADQGKIQQVLYNLIDNAIKFSPKRSTITIETTLRHDKVFVSVSDEGIGIPTEKLSRIWDRFYKIDSSRGKDQTGTGLGLAIVKEIITAHEQNIDVISTEGVGTEFKFSLEKA